MNAFKATVALLAFGIATGLTHDWSRAPAFISFVFLFLSGFVGLNLGDLFLLSAFKRIGSSRTLMIFSFQPLMMAAFAFLVFGQTLGISKLFAIFFLISCVFVISYEGYRSEKKWEWAGPLLALGGVLLDCIGVLMTRYAFDSDPQLTVMEANFYRCLGACLGFVLISRFFPFRFRRRFFRMSKPARLLVLLGSFMGTFLSLWIYLTAIEIGHLAKIAAVVGAGPLFTALLESLVLRRVPSRYLWASLLLFILGFGLLSFDLF